MAKVTIKDLLEAGCHFGHQTKRWNPKMKDFVYGAKNGISIIDLTKTMHQINDACNFLQRIVMNGGNVLFVGTKRQAQQIIQEASENTDMYYIATRWLGGTLTNNQTIRKSIEKMHELDKSLGSDDIKGLKKKEIASMNRRNTKLHRNLDGIASMKKLPDVMVIVDVCHDDIAVREAQKLKIPTVAIVDTNSNPENIDYPIAANDDAVKSIKVIMDVMIDSIKVASELNKKRIVEEKVAQEAAKAAADKKAAEEKAEKEKIEKEMRIQKEAEKEKAKKEAKAKKTAERKNAEKVARDKKVTEQAAAKKAATKPAEKKAEEKPAAQKEVAKPAEKPAEEKPAAKKEVAKPAEKKAEPAAKKEAAKPAEKPAEAKPAAKKEAAKPAVEKKPATKKVAPKKPAAEKADEAK
ncbi:MAG: 30S ribosomal protein S2 [Victivallaceae bacterium]|nr:30S ribosomal protein S2 [Victivallaceae bacterium]